MSVSGLMRPGRAMVLARLLLVGTGAWIAADAVNQYALSRWEMPVVVASPSAAGTPEVVRRPAPASYSAIVSRNIFNPEPKKAAAPVVAQPTTRPVPPKDPPIEINARLTGTVVGASPSLSFAIIMMVSKREESLYRVGDELENGILVAKIERDAVHLKRGSAERILRLFEEPKPAAPPAARGTRLPLATDQTQFALDRDEVDEALADLPRLLTQARLLPNFRAGQTDGFRIFNIVPGSLFSKIGLKNGDVLHRVNEMTLDNPTQFMGMFEQLRNQNHFTVDLMRGTERKTLEYEIR